MMMIMMMMAMMITLMMMMIMMMFSRLVAKPFELMPRYTCWNCNINVPVGIYPAPGFRVTCKICSVARLNSQYGMSTTT